MKYYWDKKKKLYRTHGNRKQISFLSLRYQGKSLELTYAYTKPTWQTIIDFGSKGISPDKLLKHL